MSVPRIRQQMKKLVTAVFIFLFMADLSAHADSWRRDSSQSIGSSDNSIIYVNPGNLTPTIIRPSGNVWDYSTFVDADGNTKSCTIWTSGVYQSVKCH